MFGRISATATSVAATIILLDLYKPYRIFLIAFFLTVRILVDSCCPTSTVAYLCLYCFGEVCLAASEPLPLLLQLPLFSCGFIELTKYSSYLFSDSMLLA
jgi:hypothetical protein